MYSVNYVNFMQSVRISENYSINNIRIAHRIWTQPAQTSLSVIVKRTKYISRSLSISYEHWAEWILFKLLVQSYGKGAPIPARNLPLLPAVIYLQRWVHPCHSLGAYWPLWKTNGHSFSFANHSSPV